jgi:hypothetical protein
MENSRNRTICRSSQNRRSVNRLLCSDLIRVTWTDESQHTHEELAVLEDFSSRGASLFLGVPIPEGATITLYTEGGEVLGVCRHCGLAPNGYLAGLSFESGVKSYVPRHLLDTSRLDFVD